MALLNDLINLDLTDATNKIIAEYIWIGGSGMDLRSKARTLTGPVDDPKKLPKWNYDGSSTGQAPGEDSEVILYPQAIFKDPFRRGNNILVMCDAYTPAGEPIPTNKRCAAAKIFSDPKVEKEVPWYGIEQEYTLLQKEVNWPLGWPLGGFPGPQVSLTVSECVGRSLLRVEGFTESSGVTGRVMVPPHPIDSTKCMRKIGGYERLNKSLKVGLRILKPDWEGEFGKWDISMKQTSFSTFFSKN
ncbi:glutamine synthetase [Tanacetum coccineum]